MFAKALQEDRDWMAFRLAGEGLTEYDRANALAMVARGVLIGSVLCGMWRKLRRA
jgi:hypothetical protein